VAAPGRDAAITAVVVALTACAFAAAGDHRTLASIQRRDDAWLRLMISGRVTPLTVIAKVFNVVGHEYVTLPVRIAIAGLLALRRWWWHLAAFAAAMVISEVLIGLLKGIYSRARPPGRSWPQAARRFPPGTQLPHRSLPSPRSSPRFPPAGAAPGGQRPLWCSRS
jgi:hypothetical protein